MKLLRLKTIREYRIFRDFSWPAELQHFGRYNVIYGWNGCGKTTVSSLLAHLQRQTNLAEGLVSFEFDSGTVDGRSLANATLPPVRVFNRDFQQQNLLEAGSELSPIYVLGQESSQKQKEIDTAKAEIARVSEQLKRQVAEETKTAKELRAFCEQKAKRIKETLRDHSHHRYNSYDRTNLQADLGSLTADEAKERLLSADQENTLRTEKDAKPLEHLSLLSPPASGGSVDAAKIRRLLSTAVIAQVLTNLVKNQELNRWVQSGLHLHAEGDACGFCGSGLPEGRLDALNAHFNESLKQLQNELKLELENAARLARNVQEWTSHDEARLYDELRNEYLMAKSILSISSQKWQGAIRTVQEQLSHRLNSIFECLAPDESLTDTLSREGASLNSAVQSLNAVIERHNQKTVNFSEAISQAREKLAWGMIADAFEEYSQRRKAATDATRNAEQTRDEIRQLVAQVEKLEREIHEHRQAADGLNADLHGYLGRNEIEFIPEENGYSVRRHGHRAQHLSEGEKTAIAFLYFLKTLQDQSFDIANGIVVIDDPVSSLDANSLFSAFAYMKERTKSCSQLFVLTHNFFFFRQIKNWFRALNNHAKKDGVSKDERPPARFYQLSASLPESQQPPVRTSKLGRLDPMLEAFESEYHFLFKTILLAHRDGLSNLEQSFPIPNTTRRLLEAFLAFRYPQRSGGNWLFRAMDEVVFDNGKKNRILRYLNTHSHTAGIDDGGGDPWGLGEITEVLSDVLDLIKAEDPKHFDGMVTKVTAKEEAA